MVGFVIGAVCLVALVKVLHHRRRWHGGYGYAHGCHPGAGFRTRGGPRGWFLRTLFERLETTPGQEKAILAALEELRGNREVVRDEMQQSRADLGRAVAGGFIDDATLEETFARQDRLLAQLRVSFVEALKKVTEALDEPQRKQAADLLAGGWMRGRAWL